MPTYLDFEKSLAELEGKAAELRAVASGNTAVDITEEVRRLDEKAHAHLCEIYAHLSPWQKCQVARHPARPHTRDYVAALFTDFVSLAGDRNYGEDPAILSGMARFREKPVIVIGHEKGSDTKSRLRHNFGMARPEGYRKAIRLMDLADRFRLPIITFIDTPGAYPGKEAEERGQAEAIAKCTEKCLSLGVPLIALVIGEGGSGGAVALATANRVAMLEHAIYSVISPEGGASILWKNAEKSQEAATALRLTAQDLMSLDVIDMIIPEPAGGGHRAPSEAMAKVAEALSGMLAAIASMSPEALRADRRKKFLSIGSQRL